MCILYICMYVNYIYLQIFLNLQWCYISINPSSVEDKLKIHSIYLTYQISDISLSNISLVVLLSCVWLKLCLSHSLWPWGHSHCDPKDCSPPGSSAHGVFQTRILEWIAISSSRGSSRLRTRAHFSCVPCIGRQIGFFTTGPPGCPRV